VTVLRSTYLHHEDKTKRYVESRGAYQSLCCTALVAHGCSSLCFEEHDTLCISDGQVPHNAIYRQVTNSDYLNVLKTIIMGKSVKLYPMSVPN